MFYFQMLEYSSIMRGDRGEFFKVSYLCFLGVMNMDLRKKFFLLAGLVGVCMAVISVIGFYTAYTNLESSVEKEFEAVVAASTLPFGSIT